MTIIDQLKKNEKPFILMTPEMQEKMKKIPSKNLHCLQAVAGEVWTTCSPAIKWGAAKPCRTTCTFRLRADYAEEPEIVECEIYLGLVDMDMLGYSTKPGEWIALQSAFRDPDFIGFKFEDGGWHDQPIKPVSQVGDVVFGPILMADIISGAVKVLHASHVLFRRQT